VQNVLVNLIFMLIEVTSGSDPLTCEGVPIPSRQRFVREQGLIDLLVLILQETFQKGRFDVGALTRTPTHAPNSPLPLTHTTLFPARPLYAAGWHPRPLLPQVRHFECCPPPPHSCCRPAHPLLRRCVSLLLAVCVCVVVLAR
jgi:hypothetical protein